MHGFFNFIHFILLGYAVGYLAVQAWDWRDWSMGVAACSVFIAAMIGIFL